MFIVQFLFYRNVTNGKITNKNPVARDFKNLSCDD